MLNVENMQSLLKEFPALSVNSLIDVGVRFLKKDITVSEIAATYGPVFVDAAAAYAKMYSPDSIEKIIGNFLAKSKDAKLVELSKEGFSKQLVDSVLNINDIVRKYCNNEIQTEEFMNMLGESGAKEVLVKVMDASNLDINVIKENIPKVINSASLITSYAAFTEAYKVLMEALNDASVQHEHRLIIEEECEKSIKLIKEYRQAMQESITAYFKEKLEVFENGFAAMDKAIIDNDSDGYIKGNAEIQQLLGHYAQFTNQEEFDNLMGSNTSFKL